MKSSIYRSPKDITQGPVLIVGGGNSGFQIAEELAASHEVHLSIGSRQTPLPQRLFGRDLFRYLDATGLIRKSTESRIGRRLSGRDTLIGSTPRGLRRRHGVQLHPRARLYFLGLSWQHTRGSALLGWVKDDAQYLAEEINRFRASAPGTRQVKADSARLKAA